MREEAEDLNQPLLIGLARGLAPGTLAPLGFDGLAAGQAAGLGALKPAEDGDGLILRVYEPAGARGRFALRLPEGWRDVRRRRPARTEERAAGRRLAEPVRSAKLAAQTGVKSPGRGLVGRPHREEPAQQASRTARTSSPSGLRKTPIPLAPPRRRRACHGGGDLLDDRLASRRRRDAQAVMAELVDALA